MRTAQPKVDAEQIDALLVLSGACDPTTVDFDGVMSITRHVTAAFPPSFISSGNGDPLAPQSRALAQRLSDLGVRVETLFFPAERTPALLENGWERTGSGRRRAESSRAR